MFVGIKVLVEVVVMEVQEKKVCAKGTVSFVLASAPVLKAVMGPHAQQYIEWAKENQIQ